MRIGAMGVMTFQASLVGNGFMDKFESLEFLLGHFMAEKAEFLDFHR